MAQPYKYLPLPTPRSIRLITVRPDPKETHGFSIAVQVAELDSAPPFCALSYTWGSPLIQPPEGEAGDREYRVSIEADMKAPSRQNSLFEPSWTGGGNGGPDVRFQAVVLENLFHFLQHFVRLPALGPRLLWIDSICIDQTNLTERGSQVGYMGDIFRAAAHVVVWLGRWEPTPDVAWILNEFAPRIVQLRQLYGPAFFVGKDAECTDPELVERLGEAACARWRGAWVSWVAFMDNLAWFRRGWVIQETVLKDNEQVTVAMGDQTFSWGSMVDFASLLGRTANWLIQLDHYGTTRHQLGRYRVENMNHRVNMPLQIRGLVAGETPMDLAAGLFGVSDAEGIWWARVFEIMGMLREKNFGDDRDQVFACIGIANATMPPGMVNPMVADYTLSVEEVFTRMAALYITNMPLLRALSTVEPSNRRRYQDLPSWVPDFSVSQVFTTLMRSGTIGRHFDAALTSSAAWPRPTVHGNVLAVQGARLDVVSADGDNFNFPGFILSILRSCLGRDQYIATGETQTEAVFRTLLADCFFTELYSSAFLPRCKTWLENFIIQEITGPLADDEDSVMDIAALLADVSDSPQHRLLPDLARIYDLRPQAAMCVAELVKDRFHSELIAMNHARRFFTTDEGFLGLGPYSMRPGDEVFLVTRSKVPFVLRKVEGPAHANEYRLVGECYVRGFMRGEGMTPDLRARIGPIRLV